MLEIEGLDFSRNLTIILNQRSVNGTNIWSVFVAKELQPDLKQKFIGLSIEFYSKKWKKDNKNDHKERSKRFNRAA